MNKKEDGQYNICFLVVLIYISFEFCVMDEF
jgi:hypothetical protein